MRHTRNTSNTIETDGRCRGKNCRGVLVGNHHSKRNAGLDHFTQKRQHQKNWREPSRDPASDSSSHKDCEDSMLCLPNRHHNRQQNQADKHHGRNQIAGRQAEQSDHAKQALGDQGHRQKAKAGDKCVRRASDVVAAAAHQNDYQGQVRECGSRLQWQRTISRSYPRRIQKRIDCRGDVKDAFEQNAHRNECGKQRDVTARTRQGQGTLRFRKHEAECAKQRRHRHRDAHVLGECRKILVGLRREPRHERQNRNQRDQRQTCPLNEKEPVKQNWVRLAGGKRWGYLAHGSR